MAARPPRPAAPARRVELALAVAVAAIALALQLVALDRQSLTNDEPYHLLAGHQALRWGENVLNLEHPPLAKLVAAVPLALEPEPYAPPSAVPEVMVRMDDVFIPPERVVARTRASRLVMLAVFALPLLAASWALGRAAAGGRAGALLALALALASPSLPYLALANTDAAIALAFVLTLLACRRWLASPGWPEAAAIGLALGFGLAVKHSAVLLVPTVVLAVVWGRARWRRRLGAALVAAAVALAVVHAVYAVADHGYDRQRGREALTLYAEGRAGIVVEGKLERFAPAILTLERWDPPLAQWLTGLASVVVQSTTASFPSYALGSVITYGEWWYFPALFAVKTPLVVLAATLAAAFLALAGRRRRAGGGAPAAGGDGDLVRRFRWLLAATAAVYLAAALGSSYNYQVRHLLPVLPILWLPAAAAAARRRWAAWGFAALLTIEAVALAPLWMSATNSWWLGAANPTRFAFVADVEYQQNYRQLAAALAERGIEGVHLVYPPASEARVAAYLPGAVRVDPEAAAERGLEAGWYAVSVLIERVVPGLLAARPEEVHRFDRYRRFAELWQPVLAGLEAAEDHGHVAGSYHLLRVPAALP